MTDTPARVLFAGSRTYSDEAMVRAVLTGLRDAARDWVIPWPFVVIHGAARGLDQLVGRLASEIWGDEHLVELQAYPAAWDRCDPDHPVVPCPPGEEHRKQRQHPAPGGGWGYCPLAGRRRNQDMLDHAKPQLVVAFVDKPLVESRGTADMVTRAAAAGVPFHVIESFTHGRQP